MSGARDQRKARTDFLLDESGQSLVEFGFSMILLLVMVFGVVDLGHGIYLALVVTNLTGEGSSLASRGTSLADSAAAVVAASAPLTLSTSGRVVVSSVYNNNNVIQLTGQASSGNLNVSSRVGTVIGGAAVVPVSAKPQLSQTVYVTEVFYTLHSITPIGQFVTGFFLPPQIYDVAYY